MIVVKRQPYFALVDYGREVISSPVDLSGKSSVIGVKCKIKVPGTSRHLDINSAIDV